MSENLLIVDDVRPVLAAIRERGIRIDAGFPGECRKLFENVGTRLHYCRKAGLRLDEVTELLYDRGFTRRRITVGECIDLLEVLFTPTARIARAGAPRQSAIDAQASKARGMRMRKFVCDCGQIVRGARATDVACGRCIRRWAESLPEEIAEYIIANLPAMRRADPLPEEILSAA